MEVREGSVTHTALIPIPEVALRPENLDPGFADFNENLLTGEYSREVALEKDDRGEWIRWSSYDALPDAPDEKFGELAGKNKGSWRYWFEYVEGEVDEYCHYDYPVQFIRPSISINLNDYHPSIKSSEDQNTLIYLDGHPTIELKDSKTSLRIHYYPFGMVAVRIRSYFKGGDSFNIPQLAYFVHNILPDLRISKREIAESWATKNEPYWDRIRDAVGISSDPQQADSTVTEESPRLFDTLRIDILAHILSPDMDNFVKRVVGGDSLGSYPIIFLYDATRLNRHDITAVLTNEHRELSEDYVDSRLMDEIGRYLEDNIFVSTSGVFAHTTAFDTMPIDRRRDRRIGLLNNLYTGTDLGMFTRKNLQIYDNLIRDIDGEAIRGSLVGEPADVSTIKHLDDIITIPEYFEGTQKHVYNLLKEEENLREFKKNVSHSTSRIVNHESKLQQVLKNIPFPFGI